MKKKKSLYKFEEFMGEDLIPQFTFDDWLALITVGFSPLFIIGLVYIFSLCHR